MPLYELMPSAYGTPMPNCAATDGNVALGNFDVAPINAVLQDLANASLRVSAPNDSLSKFWNVWLPTCNVFGHVNIDVGDEPCSMRFAVEMILNVEPGG